MEDGISLGKEMTTSSSMFEEELLGRDSIHNLVCPGKIVFWKKNYGISEYSRSPFHFLYFEAPRGAVIPKHHMSFV